MKRTSNWLAVCCYLVLGCLVLAPSPSMAADKDVYEFTFAWNDIWGPKFRASQVYAPGGVLQRMLHERSGGRIQLKIVSKMFPYMDIITSVARGKADAGDVPMPWHSGSYPLWAWGEIPNIVDPDPVKGLAEEEAVYRDPKVLGIYDRTMGEMGLKFWFVTQWDPGNGIFSKKELKTLDDLKGLKTRVGGFLPTIGIKGMGASPVSVSGSEMAQAMMSGVIDAVLTALGYGYSIGLAETSQYFTVLPLSPTWSAVTVLNKKKFDSMPNDLQKIMLDVGREVQQMVMLSTTAEYILSRDALKLSGVKVGRLEEAAHKQAVEASKPVEDEWNKLTGKDGKELAAAVRAAVDKHRSFTGK